MTSNNFFTDMFGIKPVAEAISDVAIRGPAAFLSRICSPAAEEMGYLLQDQVSHWRAKRAAELAAKAEAIVAKMQNSEELKAAPRVVFNIFEEGSWIDDAIVQDMWAGLLASACTHSGDDDSNLLFVNLLSSLTKLQAKLLLFACKNCEKYKTLSGLIYPKALVITVDQLVAFSQVSDMHRLDYELDHLREIGLIQGGFEPDEPVTINLTPSALGLNLFVRAHGSRQSPIEYFGLNESEPFEF